MRAVSLTKHWFYYVSVGVFGESTSEEDQLFWVVENGKLMRGCSVIDAVYQVLRGVISKTWYFDSFSFSEFIPFRSRS